MENPVTTPGLIEANLLDVLGNSEAGELELQFHNSKKAWRLPIFRPNTHVLRDFCNFS
jgi:hypothetical protein